MPLPLEMPFPSRQQQSLPETTTTDMFIELSPTLIPPPEYPPTQNMQAFPLSDIGYSSLPPDHTNENAFSVQYNQGQQAQVDAQNQDQYSQPQSTLNSQFDQELHAQVDAQNQDQYSQPQSTFNAQFDQGQKAQVDAQNQDQYSQPQSTFNAQFDQGQQAQVDSQDQDQYSQPQSTNNPQFDQASQTQPTQAYSNTGNQNGFSQNEHTLSSQFIQGEKPQPAPTFSTTGSHESYSQPQFDQVALPQPATTYNPPIDEAFPQATTTYDPPIQQEVLSQAFSDSSAQAQLPQPVSTFNPPLDEGTTTTDPQQETTEFSQTDGPFQTTTNFSPQEFDSLSQVQEIFLPDATTTFEPPFETQTLNSAPFSTATPFIDTQGPTEGLQPIPTQQSFTEEFSEQSTLPQFTTTETTFLDQQNSLTPEGRSLSIIPVATDFNPEQPFLDSDQQNVPLPNSDQENAAFFDSDQRNTAFFDSDQQNTAFFDSVQQNVEFPTTKETISDAQQTDLFINTQQTFSDQQQLTLPQQENFPQNPIQELEVNPIQNLTVIPATHDMVLVPQQQENPIQDLVPEEPTHDMVLILQQAALPRNPTQQLLPGLDVERVEDDDNIRRRRRQRLNHWNGYTVWWTRLGRVY